MKNKFFAVFAAFGMVLSLFGQEEPAPVAMEKTSVDYSGLKLGVGFAYRNFHSARFKDLSMKASNWIKKGGPGTSYPLMPFETGVGTLGFDNNVPGLGYVPVIATFVESSGYDFAGSGGFGLKESLAPVISLEKNFYENNGFTVGMIGNFQYYHFETATYSNGRNKGTALYETAVSGGVLVEHFMEPITDYDFYFTDETGQVPAASYSEFDMQMYQFDIGVKLGYNLLDKLFVTAAFGPSLTICDMKTEAIAASLLTAFAGMDAPMYNDKDTDFVWGMYFSAGLVYEITEHFGVAFDVRYDEALRVPSNAYASMNLDSWGAVLKLLVNF